MQADHMGCPTLCLKTPELGLCGWERLKAEPDQDNDWVNQASMELR